MNERGGCHFGQRDKESTGQCNLSMGQMKTEIHRLSSTSLARSNDGEEGRPVSLVSAPMVEVEHVQYYLYSRYISQNHRREKYLELSGSSGEAGERGSVVPGT